LAWEGDIPQGGRASFYLVPVDANTAGTAIAKTLVGMMTAGAGGRAIGRQHGVKKEVAPQVNLLRCKAIAVWRQGRFGAPYAHILQRIVKLELGGQFSLSTNSGSA